MKAKIVTLKLTEREWWLLKNGFDASFQQEDSDPETKELARIASKVDAAYRRAKGDDA
jgi:hypothetical protein